MTVEYVIVPRDRWQHLQHTKFYISSGDNFMLYTNGQMALDEKLRLGSRIPEELYVHTQDKSEMFNMLRAEWNREIKENIKMGNIKGVKDRLISVAEETVFSDP